MRRWLGTPVDAASLVAFRVLFGLLATFSSLRFVAKGWVYELYLAPTYHFAWVPWAVVPPAAVLYGMFAVMALAGLAITTGWMLRPALAVFLGCFVYVELLDKTLYLNHYVLFSWLGLWMLIIGPRTGTTPRWTLWTLRAQVGVVYLFAGLCKLNPDWLWLGEPLHTWLKARAAMPVIGGLLAHKATALFMSWGGALYDLAIPFALLWPRTRTIAYGFVLFFHLLTWWLFPIGVFPWLMIAASTVFFDPSWPRRFSAVAGPVMGEAEPVPRWGAAWLTLTLAFHLLVPLRHLATPGWVNWNEQGFRFAWRVLLIEKTGLIEFRVVDRTTGRSQVVDPTRRLSPLQDKMLATQPDLIVQYARHLAAEAAEEGLDVSVYADNFVSLNGRPTQRMVDPEVDLTQSWAALEEQGWIVPLAAR